jgi:hypothetical protein
MKYLILMHVNPAVLESLSPEQTQALHDGHNAFMTSTKENGEFVSTQACADPSRSKVIRAVDGAPQVSDGPFVEAKEFLGGFYLVDVENEERALELAGEIPDVHVPGLAVEVRPVIFADLGDG